MRSTGRSNPFFIAVVFFVCAGLGVLLAEYTVPAMFALTPSASVSSPGSSPMDGVSHLEANVDPAVVESQNRFGLRMHRWLASRAEDDNVFISPMSITLALSMVYNGASGETERAMAETMGFSPFSVQAVNESHLALIRSLTQTHTEALGVQLNVANSIWLREGFTFREAFLEQNRRFYGAEIVELDFNVPGSVDTINAWVSEETAGLIDRLVENLDADLVMLLINAVYFKGDWTTPFDPLQTRDLPFHLSSGETRPVPMMYRDGQIDYYSEPDFQAIRLPYGDDERLAMYVFLPSPRLGLDGFHALLSQENWDRWVAGFAPAHGEVLLPRMDLGYKTSLNTALQSLGMGIAFDESRADFSRIVPENARADLSISDVIHQAVLNVDEEGTEAAAATSIGVRVTSVPTYTFQFRADRPFFIAIVDELTGALLFTGSVTDPHNP